MGKHGEGQASWAFVTTALPKLGKFAWSIIAGCKGPLDSSCSPIYLSNGMKWNSNRSFDNLDDKQNIHFVSNLHAQGCGWHTGCVNAGLIIVKQNATLHQTNQISWILTQQQQNPPPSKAKKNKRRTPKNKEKGRWKQKIATQKEKYTNN